MVSRLENKTFLEVDIMAVSWWIVAFLHSERLQIVQCFFRTQFTNKRFPNIVRLCCFKFPDALMLSGHIIDKL